MSIDNGADAGWTLSTAIVLFHEALGGSLGLGAAEYKALGVIRRNGPLTLGTLAGALSVVPSAATAIADRLEDAGYVERIRDKKDRRRVLLQALPRDDSAETAVFARLGHQTADFMRTLTESQRSAVYEYIQLTTRLVEEETAHLRSTETPTE